MIAPVLRRSAVLGGDGDRYRYELRRIWTTGRPLLVACMLNPSTADHERDDPTLLSLMHFARLWGLGGVLVVNLFALRSPNPRDLTASADPVGSDNHSYIAAAMSLAAWQHTGLLVAWGAGGHLYDRAEWFASRALGVHKLTLLCLGRTADGSPKHPMARGRYRIPRDQQPIPWRVPACG